MADAGYCNNYVYCSYLQDQYILIHDAILESVTCGDTQITSNNVRYAMKKLGDAGFSYQFSVSTTHLSHAYTLTVTVCVCVCVCGMMLVCVCVCVWQVLEQVSPRSEEVKAEIADKNPNRNRSTDFPPGMT